MKINWKGLFWGIKWAFVTYLILIILAVPFIIYLSRDLPSLDEIERYRAPVSTKVYDRNGKLIYEFHEERRTPVRLKDLPPYVYNTFVALEDRKFYSHWGVDPDRILKAMVKNLLAGRIKEGASTITQQLARNMFLTHERTFRRKIKEAILAVKIERAFSKEEILERYINQVNMGGNIYGIESAAQYYFGKSAKELNPKEVAMLAGIPKHPSRYSPLKNYDAALERANFVLKVMKDQGVISEEEYEKWKDYKPEIVITRAALRYGGIAPYFMDEVRKYIIKRYGEEFLYRGGGKIYTTLDMEMQKLANTLVDSFLNLYDRRYPTKPKYWDYDPRSGKPPKYLQAAMVVMNNRTGEILAMVGGRNYFHSQFNRATQAYRQAGSAFKPFTYAAAIERGYSPADIVYDLPISVEDPTSRNKKWTPSNYDNEYLGAITLRKALALSKNLATIRLLMDIGPQAAAEMAMRLGIEENVPPYYSVALGAIEVRLIEMVNAYSTIASYGYRKKPLFITRVEDANGIILEENSPRKVLVLDSVTSYITISMMKSVVDGGTAIDARRIYKFFHPAAGKTGTTDEYRDAWFIGFTPDIVAGVWVGYDSVRTIFHGATGAKVALPIWASFMKEVYRDSVPKDFPIPRGVVFVEVCSESGKLPTPYCPKTYQEVFRAGREPKEHCDIHTAPAVSDTASESMENDILEDILRKVH